MYDNPIKQNLIHEESLMPKNKWLKLKSNNEKMYRSIRSFRRQATIAIAKLLCTPRKKKVMLASSSYTVDAEFYFNKWQLLVIHSVIQLKKPFSKVKTCKLKKKKNLTHKKIENAVVQNNKGKQTAGNTFILEKLFMELE